MKKFAVALGCAAMVGFCALSTPAFANDTDDLKKQIAELTEELEDLNDRLDVAEKHTATDKISFYGDLRTKASMIDYDSIVFNGMVDMDDTTPGGVAPMNWDEDDRNSVLYTTKLRLGMKAKVWDNMSFNGRLLMYKTWGDSTGVKYLDGFDDVTMDGTNGGNTTGDWLRVERAFFNWKKIGGTDAYLSIGRRPSTYGPPTHYRENEKRGGTPSGHLVNFNFDGITAGYPFEDLTGLEGSVLRFCYGLGFESQEGNAPLMQPNADLKDVHLGGFDIDLISDGTNFLQLLAFRALDVTDGFHGLGVMPMVDMDGDGVPGTPNQYVSRMSATKNLGDMWLGSLLFSRDEEFGLDWFVSYGYSKTEPNGNYSDMGFGGLMFNDPNMDPTADPNKDREGHSVYVGARYKLPFGKIGFEYNQGSKYWFNFTQASDDPVGSKLAVRGKVYEPYVIFDVNPKAFIKLGAIIYDYEYTGSGVQVGAPQKIDEMKKGSMSAMSPFPAVDEAVDYSVSMTLKF